MCLVDRLAALPERLQQLLPDGDSLKGAKTSIYGLTAGLQATPSLETSREVPNTQVYLPYHLGRPMVDNLDDIDELCRAPPDLKKIRNPQNPKLGPFKSDIVYTDMSSSLNLHTH